MKCYIYSPVSKLYVEESDPENNMLKLSSDKKRAAMFFRIDADTIKKYADTKTGLEFILKEV